MYDSWYQEHYHEMSGAGRWFHGTGINVLAPSEWDGRPYRVLIVRLSTARDCADSFTHQLLYQIAVSCDGVFADCAWLPPPEDGILFDHHDLPWMIGVATKRPAAHFDCIAISNSIVQELINLPTLLLKSGIPIGKRERIDRPDIPFIILGGANALFTSALCGANPAVDAIFVGEDTDFIKDLFTSGQKAKLGGEDKRTFLETLSALPGIIEPDRPRVTRINPFPLHRGRQLRDAPVFSGEGNIGVGSLQISEGCPCFCAFCAESWSRKPYREVDKETCINAALAMKASMGLDRIDLYSFNFTMHGGLKDLLWDLAESFSTIGLKSQRLDGIAEDPELPKILHAVNKSSITVGIEGISRRLRIWLQKSLADTSLHSGLTRLLQSPIRELKLFFLATGKETAADIDELRDLLAFISETMQNAHRQPRIIVSMTPLVRFPFTPLERDPAPQAATVREIILQCERLTQAKRFEFRSAASMNEYLFSQIFVRANDTRLWQSLCDTVHEMGFVYYRDISDAFMETLLKSLRFGGFTVERLLQADESFGRLAVQGPVDEAFIGNMRRASDAFHDMGYCLGSEKGAGSCIGCGACWDETQRSRIIAPRLRRPLRGELLKERIKESNKRVAVHIKCAIGKTQRGVSRHLVAACAARAFMAADPLLLRLYRGFAGSLVFDRYESDWIHGEDVLTLWFQEKAAIILNRFCDDAGFLRRLNGMLAEKCKALSLAMEVPLMRQLSLCITTPWKCDAVQYCKEQFLKHTAMRGEDGWMTYQFTKDSLKKHLLNAMKTRLDDKKSIVEIVTGDKFRYNDFIRSVVALPTQNHLVRVFCVSKIITSKE
jgi:radical SAM superfamily enzyme YgiQ (UPF0313 family)